MSATQTSIADLLPEEMALQIVSLCDKTTQNGLCRVSRRFKRLAQPKLYSNVHISAEFGTLGKFDTVLASNPHYAVWVRALYISAA
jgi:hypothetical protein